MNLTAIAIGTSQVDLSWNPSPGATGYVVERSDGGGTWAVIAGDIPALSYTDTGLAAATTYQYAVIAMSDIGDSGPSSPYSVQTGPAPSAPAGPPADALTVLSLILTAGRKQPFVGTVATFTDANPATAAGRFVATVRWGDGWTSRGTVTGADGQFTVAGRHRYAAPGRYAVQVDVTMATPSGASTSATGTAAVGGPLRIIKRAARVRHALARRTHRA
jgi:hypothetical protein